MDHVRGEMKNKSNGKSQKANGKGKISGTSSFKLADLKIALFSALTFAICDLPFDLFFPPANPISVSVT
jgi:hypothetical protein